jgi:hypothetical protein
VSHGTSQLDEALLALAWPSGIIVASTWPLELFRSQSLIELMMFDVVPYCSTRVVRTILCIESWSENSMQPANWWLEHIGRLQQLSSTCKVGFTLDDVAEFHGDQAA